MASLSVFQTYLCFRGTLSNPWRRGVMVRDGHTDLAARFSATMAWVQSRPALGTGQGKVLA